MKIETKHNIEDVVWILEGNKVVQAKVSSIEIDITISLAGGTHNEIKYSLYNKGGKFYESVVFKSKEELLQSL